MKREPQCCQTGLFDNDPRPLPILPSQQDELIDLLSQLLWQVVSAKPMFERESGGEQDRA